MQKIRTFPWKDDGLWRVNTDWCCGGRPHGLGGEMWYPGVFDRAVGTFRMQKKGRRGLTSPPPVVTNQQ